MTAANHRERIGAGKEGCSGQRSHRFLAGVDEIRIFFALERIWSNAEQSVFRLQQHLNARWDVIRAQRWHANPQVDGETVFQLAGDAARDDLTFGKVAHLSDLRLTVSFSIRFS